MVYDSSWADGEEPWLAFYTQFWHPNGQSLRLEDIGKDKIELDGGFRWGASGVELNGSVLQRQDDGSWIQTQKKTGRVLAYQYLTVELYNEFFPHVFPQSFGSTEDLQAYINQYNRTNFGLK
jgi:hypothetical protein